MRTEYDFLFRSLFKSSTIYRQVVEAVATKNKGLSQKEIKEALKISDGGVLTEVLDNLCKCDFVRKYTKKKKKEKGSIYQLTDLYSFYYLKFIGNRTGLDEHYWSNIKESARNAWAGYAFEQVCLRHVEQLKHAIGISGVSCNICSWSKIADNSAPGTQIDLLIERADGIINICEMKYSDKKYEISSSYRTTLENRISIFRESANSDQTIHLTMVTSRGLKENKHSHIVDSQVTIDDLFWSEI